MTCSRRDLSILLPLIAFSRAQGQKQRLESRTFQFEDLPVRANGLNRSRAVLDGETHTGFRIEMHMTELAPGQAPHPPHHHVHEEMIMIQEGTLEVTINGRTAKLGPGSSAYVASNEHHGWRNVGEGRAEYFVLALGHENA
jgi:quercetin dioxygenase-like cupin family protein